MNSPTMYEELFERSRNVAQLLCLSREQLQLMESEDYDGLWRLQQQKQTLAALVYSNPSSPDPLRDRWLNSRDTLPAEERARCEAELERCERLLATLLQEEQVNIIALQERMETTRRQLQSIAQGQRTRNLYARTDAEPSGQLMDLQT